MDWTVVLTAALAGLLGLVGPLLVTRHQRYAELERLLSAHAEQRRDERARAYMALITTLYRHDTFLMEKGGDLTRDEYDFLWAEFDRSLAATRLLCSDELSGALTAMQDALQAVEDAAGTHFTPDTGVLIAQEYRRQRDDVMTALRALTVAMRAEIAATSVTTWEPRAEELATTDERAQATGRGRRVAQELRPTARATDVMAPRP